MTDRLFGAPEEHLTKAAGASAIHLEAVAVCSHIITRGLQYLGEGTPDQLERLHSLLYYEAARRYRCPEMLPLFEEFLQQRYAAYDDCGILQPFALDPTKDPGAAVMELGDLFFEHVCGISVHQDQALAGESFIFRSRAAFGLVSFQVAMWKALKKIKGLSGSHEDVDPDILS